MHIKAYRTQLRSAALTQKQKNKSWGGSARDMVTPGLCGGTRMQKAHVKYIGRNSYQAVEVQCDIHIWIKPDQIVNTRI